MGFLLSPGSLALLGSGWFWMPHASFPLCRGRVLAPGRGGGWRQSIPACLPACLVAVSTPGPHLTQQQPTLGHRVVRRTDTRSTNLTNVFLTSQLWHSSSAPEIWLSAHLVKSGDIPVVTLGVADLPLDSRTPVGGARDGPQHPIMHRAAHGKERAGPQHECRGGESPG